MVLMIKPFNKHIASLMVIELQLSSLNTFCLNTTFTSPQPFCICLIFEPSNKMECWMDVNKIKLLNKQPKCNNQFSL